MLTLLLPLTIVGCKTVPKKQPIILPPKPERKEMPEVKSVKDFGLVINYYEQLVQSWEAWGEKAEKAIEESNNDTDYIYQYLSW